LIVAKGHIMIATLQKVSLVTGAAQFQALFDALSKVVGEAMVHAQIVAIGCSGDDLELFQEKRTYFWYKRDVLIIFARKQKWQESVAPPFCIERVGIGQVENKAQQFWGQRPGHCAEHKSSLVYLLTVQGEQAINNLLTLLRGK